MSYYRDKKSKSGSEGGVGGKRKFRDSIEAFYSVLEEKGTNMTGEGAVSKIEVESRYVKSGLEHTIVQILCRDGAGYRIDAFGDEARALFRISHRYVPTLRASSTRIGEHCLIPVPIAS